MSDKKTALTVRIDRDLLQSARLYASQHRITLSQMINNYLRVFVIIQDDSFAETPIFHRLSGIINMDSNIDEFKNHLVEKYDKTAY